jgi:hypothetical protein
MPADKKPVNFTAVLTADDEMIVHASRCVHGVRDMTYPQIRERLHLSGTGRTEVTEKAWRGSLSAFTPRSEQAGRTSFASCAAGLEA